MDDISLGIVIAQIINFLILFFIFKHFLGDKLVKLIEERKKQLDKISHIESDVKERMEKAEKEAQKIVDAARVNALEIEKSSENLAKKSKEKLIADAEMQAKSIITGAEANIEKERLAMLGAIRSKVVHLALKLNEKLFSSERVNKDFMEKELDGIMK
jgi:F-type H+-transporting ATPase subunit b